MRCRRAAESRNTGRRPSHIGGVACRPATGFGVFRRGFISRGRYNRFCQCGEFTIVGRINYVVSNLPQKVAGRDVGNDWISPRSIFVFLFFEAKCGQFRLTWRAESWNCRLFL